MSQRDKGETPSILLCNPKYPHNVGGIVRIASCFGVKQLWWTGDRVTLDPTKGRLPREERMKGYADVTLFANREKPFDAFPPGTTPVGIELVKGAQLLPRFEHPKNPIYVFGPEDGSIPQSIRKFCHSFVAIPTYHCLNLSNAVSLVLYDRLLKQMESGEVQGWTMDDFLKEQRGWYDNTDPACGIEGLQGDEVTKFQSVGSAKK